jgi:hypothetical protein
MSFVGLAYIILFSPFLPENILCIDPSVFTEEQLDLQSKRIAEKRTVRPA